MPRKVGTKYKRPPRPSPNGNDEEDSNLKALGYDSNDDENLYEELEKESSAFSQSANQSVPPARKGRSNAHGQESATDEKHENLANKQDKRGAPLSTDLKDRNDGMNKAFEREVDAALGPKKRGRPRNLTEQQKQNSHDEEHEAAGETVPGPKTRSQSRMVVEHREQQGHDQEHDTASEKLTPRGRRAQPKETLSGKVSDKNQGSNDISDRPSPRKRRPRVILSRSSKCADGDHEKAIVQQAGTSRYRSILPAPSKAPTAGLVDERPPSKAGSSFMQPVTANDFHDPGRLQKLVRGLPQVPDENEREPLAVASSSSAGASTEKNTNEPQDPAKALNGNASLPVTQLSPFLARAPTGGTLSETRTASGSVAAQKSGDQLQDTPMLDRSSSFTPAFCYQPFDKKVVGPGVIEYLSKKGYNRTEAMLRTESAAQDADGRPITKRTEEEGRQQFFKAMGLLETWVDGLLDIYKPELRRLLWPVFVYSFLELVERFHMQDAKNFMEQHRAKFEFEHGDDIRQLSPIALPEHLDTSSIAKIYRGSRYRLTLSTAAYYQLISFLENKEKEGGSVLLTLLNTRIRINAIERASEDTKSLASMLSKASVQDEFPAEDEGIPGHNPGSANTEAAPGSAVLTRLKLGPLPIEPELLEDVMAELAEEDEKNPPPDGKPSLVEEYKHMIKREDTDDAPTRAELPLPASKERDVLMEVLRVKENRDRYKLGPTSDGNPTNISTCMFTFHNAYDTINCIAVSDNNQLIAAGTSESYIRVWTIDGKPIQTMIEGEAPCASRRLIGHSQPVYNISFSPSIDKPDQDDSKPFEPPNTVPNWLLSCAGDKEIRLWHLGTWQCMVAYKGHLGPVFDVTWGPFGHYFLTGSWDKQAHLFATTHVAPLRTFIGHDSGVDRVCFHPNGCYVFTAGADKTVRMWAVSNAFCVRMFTGHTGYINAMKCSPSGKLLATADDAGCILLWDLGPGRLLKRMRGHDKGGIWEIAWSAESHVLISGGEDGTVRVWDVTKRVDAPGQGKVVGEGGTGTKIDGSGSGGAGQGAAAAVAAAAAGASGGGSSGKKKAKGVVVTSDQIGVFPTKKTPVKYVKFTRMNLAVAAGCYQG